ncbi:DUF3050 domain-containing protein [Flavobacterium sp. CBA20B-1]|uniref:DUF3050 domain-containing protein n=1 Tax=unclassified Flavobacterium TaxID=196869 RepID=UPI002224BABD|nr:MULTISPECIES: DUF3050 domain-containing protein [unclassified Flavobacterium]WCM41494.1 DUF3050 domain-containing protein [Flavobacterium sp. CBA20B-1]
MNAIASVNKAIEPLKKELIHHSLYKKITTIPHLQLFMQTHVYAVWDFMSLLKALQSQLTCTSSPWFASSNPQARYLINEIVLAEESDLSLDGKRLSHFEMYVQAMKKSGTDTESLDLFLNNVQSTDVFSAIKKSNLHDHVKAFLEFTFQVIENGKSHEIAAAFTFGREDLIPTMFHHLLKELKEQFPEVDLSELIYYFERHIELDADEHGPMAFEMIDFLCGTNEKKWQEVEQIAKIALQKRILLWNAIEEMIEKSS